MDLVKRLLYFLSISFLLWVAACHGEIETVSPKATPQEIAFTATIIPTITPANTRTPVATLTTTPTPGPTQMPTSTATPNSDLIWSEDVTLTRQLNAPFGQLHWSPAANEVVFGCTENPFGETEIYRAIAPEFVPTKITPTDFECPTIFYILWAPDGQHLAITPADIDTSLSPPVSFQVDQSDIWLIDAEGNRLDIHFPIRGRYANPVGWATPLILVYTEYYSGGEGTFFLADVNSGDVLVSLSLHSSSPVPGGKDYVAIKHGPMLHSVSAVPIGLAGDPAVQARVRHLSLTLPIIPATEEQTWLRDIQSQFIAWRPGTNEILVLTAPREAFEPVQLQLWQVEEDELTLIDADGVCGRFSPDGRLLAHRTLTQDGAQLHVQDMETGQIRLTLPSPDEPREVKWFNAEICTLHASFSPNGRYLAVLVPGQLQTVDDNSLALLSIDSQLYLYVLDTETLEIIAAPGMANGTPDWSPSGHQILYRDHDDQWLLFDMTAERLIPLTVNNGDLASWPQWSFDGRYLSFVITRDGYSDTVIIQVPE
jgi:hypothetical protein